MKVGGRHSKAPYLAYARANGWGLERTNGGHIRARKDGHLQFLSMTPGGGRAKENCLAKLEKCDKGRCHCHLRHAALSHAG